MLKPLPLPFPYTTETPVVSELMFLESGVKVSGLFELNEFAVLSTENLEFLRLYIKVRGNLKEVERILGVSYPTVRTRFETMLKALGYESDETSYSQQTLNLLERGEISPDEAIQRLKK